MNVPDRYYIGKISEKRKEKMIMKHHYLHRMRGATYVFGLYDKEEKENTFFGDFDSIVGVIMYSVPAAFQLCEGICGKEYKDKVIELSRLWIKDGTLKNVESFMISKTLKMLDNHDIVISYTDPGANHRGIIYQVTNFLYTGMGAKGTEVMIKGMSHDRGTPKIGGYEALCKKYGKENIIKRPRQRKHRYVYFACSKKKRKLYMEKLTWPVLPYPKEINNQNDND